MAQTIPSPPVIHIGAESLIPDDPTTHYSRAVNFAPGHAETVYLNPPRFRWRYHPTQTGRSGNYDFRFQIAKDPKFHLIVFEVKNPFNFYNTLPPLESPSPFYWRIQYLSRNDNTPTWGGTRTFTIAENAQLWDRSSMANPDFSDKPHPRILFTEQSLSELRNLVKSHPDSRPIFRRMVRDAEEILQSHWWQNSLPENDHEPASKPYYQIAHDLVLVAFVYRITNDPQYARVKDHALHFARYPKGGRSSPEGAGGEKDANEDAAQATEFLALLYDWLYPDLSPPERKAFETSLDWRIHHFLYHFAWKRKRTNEYAHSSSLSNVGGSHEFEGFFDTFPACLAAYEVSEHARTGFHLGINHMAGVGSAHGFDEGWNEGPGYANSKWAWQVNAMSYLDSVFPDYGVGQNPWLLRTGAFLRLQTPVGLQHAPWGHGSNKASYYENGHHRAYRKLAFLTGDGRFLANWQAYGNTPKRSLARPWIECALPLWRQRPDPIAKEEHIRAFPNSGWVMAMSGPSSDPNTYAQGLGIIFCSRPRGGYSHSFACDNSFHLFGYGQDLSNGAGTSPYGGAYAYHSMSHNTVLIDGMGQSQPIDQNRPYFSRLIAFHKTDDLSYWCGDATLSYPQEPHLAKQWWGRLDDLYEKRDLRHLKRFNRYFIILDDLEASKPATFTWLYHILPEGNLGLDTNTGSFSYNIEDVRVEVTYLLGQNKLDVQNLMGQQALTNPLTGEDYTKDWTNRHGDEPLSVAHNLFLTNREPQTKWRFLCVILPIPPGDSAEHTINRLDDLTVQITAFGATDIISFDPDTPHLANIRIDLPAIAKTGIH